MFALEDLEMGPPSSKRRQQERAKELLGSTQPPLILYQALWDDGFPNW